MEGTCPLSSQVPFGLSCTDWLLEWHLITFQEDVAGGGSMNIGVMGCFILGYFLNLTSLQEKERKQAFMEYILCSRHCLGSFTYAAIIIEHLL